MPDALGEALVNFKEIAVFARGLASTWTMLEGVQPLDLVFTYDVLNKSNCLKLSLAAANSATFGEFAAASEQSTLIGGDSRLVVADTAVRDVFVSHKKSK